MKLRISKWLWGLLGVFLLFQLLTLPFYGVNWDEGSYQYIGKRVIAYLSGQIPYLTFEHAGLQHYGSLFNVLNIWLGTILLGYGVAYADAFHVLTVLLGSLTFLFLFIFVKSLTNTRTAFLATLFLMLSPRFLAQLQYNVQEIPVVALGTGAFTFFYLFFSQKKTSYAWIGALCFGLAMTTKLSALLIIPIVLGTVGLSYLIHKPSLKILQKDIRFLSIFFIGGIVFMYATWPTLWGSFSAIISAFNFFFHQTIWVGTVLYFGNLYTSHQLPWHYIPFYFLVTTPLLELVFVGIGMVMVKRNKSIPLLGKILLFVWLFLPLLASLRPGQSRYDGIRQYLIIFPAMAVMAGIGLDTFIAIIHKRFVSSFAVTACVFFLILELVWQNAIVFPYGDAYYNEVFVAVAPKPIEQSFELEYWGVAYREGVEWLNMSAAPGAVVCVPFADHLIVYYPVRNDIRYACAKDADYLMFISRKSYIPKDLDEVYQYTKRKPIYSVKRYDSSLLDIYYLKP